MTTKITYVKGYTAPTPSEEAARQVQSAISLIRDRLSEVIVEHPWSPEQEARFDAADDLLRQAHALIRKIGEAGGV